MAISTALDVVQAALRDLGVLAAGEVASAQDASDGLDAMNGLLDQWKAERLLIYTVTRTLFTIVSGTQTYTVGVGGTVNVARPVYVADVRLVDTTPNPDNETSLATLTDDGWAAIAQKANTGPYPSSFYYDPTYPLGTLSLWPTPTLSTLQGVLYAPGAVAEYATLNTSFALPPGYRRMVIKSLALELAPTFGAQLNPMLIEAARESKAVVKRSNGRLSDLAFESAALIQGGGGSSYNIWTDR